jgi:hypothetical protein
VLGWPGRRKLARAFLWECSYGRLKLAQLRGRHGVSLTWPVSVRPASSSSSDSSSRASAASPARAIPTPKNVSWEVSIGIYSSKFFLGAKHRSCWVGNARGEPHPPGSKRAYSRGMPSAAGEPAGAREVSGWPKRCKLAHAFLWEHSYKRLKLAQLLVQLGVFSLVTLIEQSDLALVGSMEAVWWY